MTGAGVVAALKGAADFSSELMYKWLDGPTPNETLNVSLHWGAMATGGLLSAWISSGNASWSILSPGAGKGAIDSLNQAMKALNDPNIEGIVIRAESQTTTRDVDVSTQMIISQQEKDNNKKWVTDNAVPRPRVWQVSGYLQAMPQVDAFLAIKPTIQAQLAYLDFMASSRRPVWFKAHYSLFYRVLIEHFTYSFDPRAQNVVKVDLTLREFVVNTVFAVTASEKAQRTTEKLGGTQ